MVSADDLYSLTLLAALIAAGAAATAAATGWVAAHRPGAAVASLRRLARWGSALAAASLAISVAVHLAFGHRPGTPPAMAPVEFLGEHPAFVVAAVLAFAAWLGAR